MVRTRLQNHPSVCGFYTIYATFHLFKFQQEKKFGVHDVNILFFCKYYHVIVYQLTVNVHFIQCICSTWYILINFFNFTTIFSSITKAMASRTPSAQVRIPVGDIVFLPPPPPPPPPQLQSHYTNRGKISVGGRLIIRRRKDYAAAE